MKVTKPNGLGRFGAIIDDFDHTSLDDWKELKEINLKSLATLVRGNGKDNFNHIERNATIVGRPRRSQEVLLSRKYGNDFYLKRDSWDEVDKKAFRARVNWAGHNSNLPDTWHSVSGKLDENGKTTGTFAGSRCLWHSNESGCYHFAPLVMLYGAEGMVGSATGFCSSIDWYEKQSESFRSELDEMVVRHAYKPFSIAPDGDEDHEAVMRTNFTTEGGIDMPLVIKSPGGIKGLHFSDSTITGIVGMSKEESDKLIERIAKEIYVDEYIWDAWWEHDTGDLLLFDNTIIVHNRSLKENVNLSNRFGIRSAMDYQGLFDYKPFYQEEFNKRREEFLIPMTHNSNAFFKHHTKQIIQKMADDERSQYVLRFTADELDEILNYDIDRDDPHLARYIIRKKHSSY